MATLENLDPAVRLEDILDRQDIEPATRLEYFLKKATEGGGGVSAGIGYYNTRELLTAPVSVPNLTTGGSIELSSPPAALVDQAVVSIYVTDHALPFLYEDVNSGTIALPSYINENVDPLNIPNNPSRQPTFYVRSISDNAKNFVLTSGEDKYIFYNISDVDIVYGYTAGGTE